MYAIAFVLTVDYSAVCWPQGCVFRNSLCSFYTTYEASGIKIIQHFSDWEHLHFHCLPPWMFDSKTSLKSEHFCRVECSLWTSKRELYEKMIRNVSDPHIQHLRQQTHTSDNDSLLLSEKYWFCFAFDASYTNVHYYFLLSSVFAAHCRGVEWGSFHQIWALFPILMRIILLFLNIVLLTILCWAHISCYGT